MPTEPPGHRASPTRFATAVHAFPSLTCTASALAHDVATTARAQWPTTCCSTRRDYHLWTPTRVCPEPRFASRGAADCALLMKLILDLDSLVERVRLLMFALTSLMDHTFCHTRLMMLFSFPSFVLSSLRPDDRSSGHTFYFSAYLLVSRCASGGLCMSKSGQRGC